MPSQIHSRFFTLVAAIVIVQPSHADESENRWEANIEKFEQQDQQSPPAANSVLFIGSSSIRGWDLERSFPGKNYLNRGFGGSEISDSIHFADRIIVPYRPRVIVLYAGDNDISRGKTPEVVTADFQKFVKTVHTSLPKTRIVFIAIKPSIKRWSLVDKMRTANAAIQRITKKDSRLEYVDIDKPMIGDDGQPRKELFASDGLHLSAAGYELWASLVKPHLAKKTASLILHDGKIVTVDKQFSIAEAVKPLHFKVHEDPTCNGLVLAQVLTSVRVRRLDSRLPDVIGLVGRR